MKERKKTSSEYKKEYCQKHKEERSAYAKKWRKNHPTYKKEYYRALRSEVLSYYSKGKLKCDCCGESEIEFLSIDHINGRGAEHRRKVKGKNLYNWLKKNNYPKGFQVLCFNCNLSYGHYGYCPHTIRKKEVR